MSEERHFITSWQDRHERIKNIANVLDAYLAKVQSEQEGGGRELHTLRGLCEQLRYDAEGIRLGTDGSKGTKEVEA
tara:strand:+ start:4146 stop:4373 length:228 start_codon:yes stop_codon:yes gene_type:complete